jgi:hypothetical protein
MKALSVKQPHAAFIASEKKSIEVRSWSTKFRGDVIIASSASPDRIAMDGLPPMPGGVTLCIVDLFDVRPLVATDADAARMPEEHIAKLNEEKPHYAWCLRNIRPIATRAVKGRLGLWEIEL